MDQNNQQLIKASVVIVALTGIIGALSIVADGIGATSGKIFSLCLSLILYGITATISMVVTRKPEYKILGTAGIIVSGLGFLLLAIIILGEVNGSGLIQLAFALFIAAIALAHICLLHNFNLQNKYAHYARMTATIAIAIFSLILITRIFEPLPNLYSLAGGQSVLKVIVAALIVDLAATLLVPLCNRLKVETPVEELSFTPEPPPVQNEQPPVE